jgi:predicted N-acetyltransferase YhbS
MEITIKKETERDYAQITHVHSIALGIDEARLVEKLRKTPCFISELSLVAVLEGVVVGHVLFYPININTANRKHVSLALAPISILPAHQRKGIGSALIRKGLEAAKKLGFQSIIVIGHAKYYPRFGFKRASQFGISAPFPVPGEVFFAMELDKDALKNCRGTVEYPKEFGV